MLRLLLIPMVALTLMFGAAIGSIRAQPDDTAYRQSLRDFLLPPQGCAAPCWQGIRPNETTLTEALALLESRGWSGSVNFQRGMAMDTGLLVVQWSGQQPSFINSQRPAIFWIEANVVERMSIALTIPYGAAWLSLSPPEQGAVSLGSVSTPILSHYAAYTADDFVLYSGMSCPLTPQRLWDARIELLLGMTDEFDLSEYDLAGWLHDPVC